jgi:hypothetical protein
VSKDTTTTATFGNYQKTKIKVIKTVELAVPAASDGNITFQLRQGASISSQGTMLATSIANNANGGVIGPDSWTILVPGKYPLIPGDYQFCEAVPMGYDSSLKSGVYGMDWFYPGIDPNNVASSSLTNEVVCVKFTVVSGSDTAGDDLDNTIVFKVDNGRPALQRTIGFWKNWASCSNSKGGQAPYLDQTLAKSPIIINALAGIWNGDLFVDTCWKAVSLLNKAPVQDPPTAKPKSSDPAFNASAQLVAFQLNILIPSSNSCTAANSAADLIQDYLDQVNFKGSSTLINWKSGTNAKIAANLNFLAQVLDHYNNATLKSGALINGKAVNCTTNVTTLMPYSTVLPTSNLHDALP